MALKKANKPKQKTNKPKPKTINQNQSINNQNDDEKRNINVNVRTEGTTVVIDDKQINELRTEILSLKNLFEEQKKEFNEINKFIESEKQSRNKRRLIIGT